MFDLIVIGAGSGTTVSAAVADAGWKVAVIDSGPFGGTCLNRGCIPSKMLVHVADVARTIRHADRFGIQASIERIDWPAIVERVFEDIDRDAAQIEAGNRDAPNITVFKGEARFDGDPHRISVDGQTIEGKQVVIAAGSRPTMPPIPGLEQITVHTSDDVMRLERQPRRLAIVGGGFVTAELGHFFRELGTEVTLLVRGDRMLAEEDDDISARFTEVYQRRFDVRLKTEIAQAAQDGDDAVLTLAGDGVDGEGAELRVDAVLMATGRQPNTDTLHAAEVGIDLDQAGFVKTDEHLRTSVEGVWALGDIVGEYLLKHSANMEAAYVAHNLLNPNEQAAVDYHAMPHAVFASPQIGSVGLTERELKASGQPYVVGSYDYNDTAYGASIEDNDGFVKVLADPETREMLGVHILGSDASILVQGPATLMRSRSKVDVIQRAIFVHPALPEVIQRAVGQLDL